MNITELENKLQEHGQCVRNHMTSPFPIEREEFVTMKKRNKITTSFVLIAAIICMFATTAYAAYRYLNAGQVADSFGDTKLAEAFGDSRIASETLVDGDYKATILGMTSGKNLSDFKSSAWDVFPERTYVTVAIEKTDGSDMTYDDAILVTPLIEGLQPWQYNIVTMNGGYSANIIDGVLYRIIEIDSIEYFADRQVYLAVLDSTFYNKEAYHYDENTGLISSNENYNGTNMLFDLKLDKSKANQEKAAEYLEELEKSWSADESE